MSSWTLFETDADCGAEFSECGRYRYTLTRRWDAGAPALFIMLNPSTATATQDDPTIRRCIGYARDWGFAGLTVLNLYAYRATDPRELWKVDNPVGPGNDNYLVKHLKEAWLNEAPAIAAWGAHARPDRVAAVMRMPHTRRLQALGTTKAGAPRHPLYMPKTAEPQLWPGGAS